MDILINTLNIIVVILFTIAYVPQIVTTFKNGNSDGVSEKFWYFVALSTAISLHNLLVTGQAEWYVYLGQIINAGLAFLFFAWFNIKNNKDDKLLLSGYFLAYLIVLPLTTNFTMIELSQGLASATIIVAYIYQIHHFYIVKSSEGVNSLLFLLFAVGIGILTIIMSLTGVNPHVIITEVINIILLLICFFMTLKYRINKL